MTLHGILKTDSCLQSQRGREWFPSWSLRRAELCHFDFGHGTPDAQCSRTQVSGHQCPWAEHRGLLTLSACSCPQLFLQVITGQKEQTAVGSYVDRLGMAVTREAGKGRGKVIGLLGTLGRLLLDCGMYSLPRGHVACCEGTLHTTHRGGEDLNPESSTHRLGAVSAAVPRLILGQPLFLLVQRPRLQDHLFQLKGGITVQAAFLWRDRVLSPACKSPTSTPTAWSHLSGHMELTLGTKPGSTFFSLRSSHSTWASDGAVCMSWRLENRCSGFTVRSCKEVPSQIKPHRRIATCPRLKQPLKVSTG